MLKQPEKIIADYQHIYLKHNHLFTQHQLSYWDLLSQLTNTQILEKTNSKLREAIMSFEQQNQQLQAELTKILQQMQASNQLIEQLQNKLNQLDEKIESKQQIEQVQQETKQLQNKLNRLDKKIESKQQIEQAQQEIQQLQAEINHLISERTAIVQHAHNLEQNQAHLMHLLNEEIQKFAKYKSLWTNKLLKPLVQTEKAISSANRYRKAFRILVKEKGSIGKAYQTVRRKIKSEGFKSGKQFLRNTLYPAPIAPIATPSLPFPISESLSTGFVILTTKHTSFIAHLIAENLSKVGIQSKIIFEIPKAGYATNQWYIVICPQIFERLPEHYLAFQMEQSVSSRWFTENSWGCPR